jgi:hypothetical protein
MTLEGDQLRLLVLSSLANQAATLWDGQRDAGVRPDQLEALRNLAASDLAQLAKMRHPEISVRIDPIALDHGLRTLDYVRKRTEIIEYFIRHGATISMLVALFKLVPADVAKYRARLGVSAAGRPKMPSAAQREMICARWFAIRVGSERMAPTADNYSTLHREFDELSLATLYAVINEFAA